MAGLNLGSNGVLRCRVDFLTVGVSLVTSFIAIFGIVTSWHRCSEFQRSSYRMHSGRTWASVVICGGTLYPLV